MCKRSDRFFSRTPSCEWLQWYSFISVPVVSVHTAVHAGVQQTMLTRNSHRQRWHTAYFPLSVLLGRKNQSRKLWIAKKCYYTPVRVFRPPPVHLQSCACVRVRILRANRHRQWIASLSKSELVLVPPFVFVFPPAASIIGN